MITFPAHVDEGQGTDLGGAPHHTAAGQAHLAARLHVCSICRVCAAAVGDVRRAASRWRCSIDGRGVPPAPLPNTDTEVRSDVARH